MAIAMCADSDLSGEVDGMCGEEFGRLLDTDLRRNRAHRGSEALHGILGFGDVENEEARSAPPQRREPIILRRAGQKAPRSAACRL
jgi:hypothetical protein